jgi:hypothetical protein
VQLKQKKNSWSCGKASVIESQICIFEAFTFWQKRWRYLFSDLGLKTAKKRNAKESDRART